MKHEKRNMKNEEGLFLNKDLPYTMHIDLNSCFAIIEQQANRLLRGKPVGIAAYDTPRGFVVAASYEAKTKGVVLGVNVEQARTLAPGIVIMTPDPAKYREAHRLFKEVLLEYSPDVTPKSIDEFILNLEHSPVLANTKNQIQNSNSLQISNINYQISESERLIHNQAMLKIGNEIKDKIRQRLGDWVTVNIGISTNKFLAKYAAGFDKPNGMTLIDRVNLRKKYENMKLTDLPGINMRYRARLREYGIYTPLDFLDADMHVLKKQVFKSINGYHWYMRLRGYETDTVEFSRKSIGHQHALSNKTMDMAELERLLLKLCEKTGRRLRKNNYYATGIHLYLGFVDQDRENPNFEIIYPKQTRNNKTQNNYEGPASFENMPNIRSWHHGEKVFYRLYSTSDIYKAAKRLLRTADIPNNVKIMSVHVFGLQPWDPVQLNLFEVQKLEKTNSKSENSYTDQNIRNIDSKKRVSDAVDAINNRYGEFVITPAMMLDMQGTILDRIAFGQVRDI